MAYFAGWTWFSWVVFVCVPANAVLRGLLSLLLSGRRGKEG